MTFSFSTQRAVEAAFVVNDAKRVLASFQRAHDTLIAHHQMDEGVGHLPVLMEIVWAIHDRLAATCLSERNTFNGVSVAVEDATNFFGALLYMADAGGHPTVFLTVQDARYIIAAKALADALDALVGRYESAVPKATA